MKKMLLTASGIMIAVLFIAFMVGGFNLAKGKAEKALNGGIGDIDALELAKYTDFDGRTDISGATVYNFIKDRENHNDGFFIAVGNVSYVYAKTTDGSGAKLSKSQEQTLLKNANTRGNAAYINQQATYSAKCNYVGNAGSEVLIGITFTKN